MIPLALCIFGWIFLFLASVENEDKLSYVLLGVSFGCFFSAFLVFLLLINN